MDNKIIKKILYLISLVLALSIVFFYKDLNYFNKLREEYIKNETANIIYCPLYDNKYNFPFYEHLIGDNLYCDVSYLKMIIGSESEINSINGKFIKIR